MTSTMDRPITDNRTWQLTAALTVLSEFLAGLFWADLPELGGADLDTHYSGRPEVRAQICHRHPDTAAQAALAWRERVPRSRVVIDHHGGGFVEFWRVTVVVPGTTTIRLWGHLAEVSDEQAARLERDPQTAYAVLREIARSGR